MTTPEKCTEYCVKAFGGRAPPERDGRSYSPPRGSLAGLSGREGIGRTEKGEGRKVEEREEEGREGEGKSGEGGRYTPSFLPYIGPG